MTMASSTVSFVDEIYDQFLLCRMCSQIYQSPKVLACMHTFCEKCLDRHYDMEEQERPYRFLLYNRALACPLCHSRTELPTGGVHRLPDNFLVANLADVVNRQKPSAKSPFCEICRPAGGGVSRNEDQENEKRAVSKCLDCVKMLCSGCSELHRRTRVTQNHGLFDIQVEKDIECKLHANETLRFYCEPCQECVCVLCTFHDHKDHDVSSLIEALDRHRGPFEALMERCRGRMESLEEQVDLIDRCERGLRQAEEHIRDSAIDAIAAIRKREKEMLTELKETLGEQTLDFIAEKETFKENLKNLDGTFKLTSAMLKGTTIDLLVVKKEMENKLNLVLDAGVKRTPEALRRNIQLCQEDYYQDITKLALDKMSKADRFVDRKRSVAVRSVGTETIESLQAPSSDQTDGKQSDDSDDDDDDDDDDEDDTDDESGGRSAPNQSRDPAWQRPMAVVVVNEIPRSFGTIVLRPVIGPPRYRDSFTQMQRVVLVETSTSMPTVAYSEKETSTPHVHILHKNVSTDNQEMVDKSTTTAVDVTAAYRGVATTKRSVMVSRGTCTPRTMMLDKETLPIPSSSSSRGCSPVAWTNPTESKEEQVSKQIPVPNASPVQSIPVAVSGKGIPPDAGKTGAPDQSQLLGGNAVNTEVQSGSQGLSAVTRVQNETSGGSSTPKSQNPYLAQAPSFYKNPVSPVQSNESTATTQNAGPKPFQNVTVGQRPVANAQGSIQSPGTKPVPSLVYGQTPVAYVQSPIQSPGTKAVPNLVLGQGPAANVQSLIQNPGPKPVLNLASSQNPVVNAQSPVQSLGTKPAPNLFSGQNSAANSKGPIQAPVSRPVPNSAFGQTPVASSQGSVQSPGSKPSPSLVPGQHPLANWHGSSQAPGPKSTPNTVTGQGPFANLQGPIQNPGRTPVQNLASGQTPLANLKGHIQTPGPTNLASGQTPVANLQGTLQSAGTKPSPNLVSVQSPVANLLGQTPGPVATPTAVPGQGPVANLQGPLQTPGPRPTLNSAMGQTPTPSPIHSTLIPDQHAAANSSRNPMPVSGSNPATNLISGQNASANFQSPTVVPIQNSNQGPKLTPHSVPGQTMGSQSLISNARLDPAASPILPVPAGALSHITPPQATPLGTSSAGGNNHVAQQNLAQSAGHSGAVMGTTNTTSSQNIIGYPRAGGFETPLQLPTQTPAPSPIQSSLGVQVNPTSTNLTSSPNVVGYPKVGGSENLPHFGNPVTTPAPIQSSLATHVTPASTNLTASNNVVGNPRAGQLANPMSISGSIQGPLPVQGSQASMMTSVANVAKIQYPDPGKISQVQNISTTSPGVRSQDSVTVQSSLPNQSIGGIPSASASIQSAVGIPSNQCPPPNVVGFLQTQRPPAVNGANQVPAQSVPAVQRFPGNTSVNTAINSASPVTENRAQLQGVSPAIGSSQGSQENPAIIHGNSQTTPSGGANVRPGGPTPAASGTLPFGTANNTAIGTMATVRPSGPIPTAPGTVPSGIAINPGTTAIGTMVAVRPSGPIPTAPTTLPSGTAINPGTIAIGTMATVRPSGPIPSAPGAPTSGTAINTGATVGDTTAVSQTNALSASTPGNPPVQAVSPQQQLTSPGQPELPSVVQPQQPGTAGNTANQPAASAASAHPAPSRFQCSTT